MNRITIVIAALAATGALTSLASAERLSPSECRSIEDMTVSPGYTACPSEPDEAKGSAPQGAADAAAAAGAAANAGAAAGDAPDGAEPGAASTLSTTASDGDAIETADE